MEDFAKLAFIVYVVGIVLLFLINFIYFLTRKPTEEDQLFEYDAFNYNYEDTINRIVLLEKFRGRALYKLRKKINHCHQISKRPLRTFQHFEERIERGILMNYAQKGNDKPVTYMYDKLSVLFKFEVFYTLLFFPVLLVVSFFYIEINSIFLRIVLFLFSLIVVYSFYFRITRITIELKYAILKLLFTLFKKPVGAIRRNINSLGYLMYTSHFHRPFLGLMFISLISAFGVVVKGTAKSFKGGKFGGGGAGGSW